MSGLSKMLKVCQIFCETRGVRFNPKKSICMTFTFDRGRADPHISIGDTPLQWSKTVKHLGNYIEYNLNESAEISRKRGDLFGRVNSMLGNLQGMPSDVLMKVFESQCCHLYGCQAWRLCDSVINKMRTAFKF